MANDFEWLSNNLFIAYPFAAPAPLLDVSGGTSEVFRWGQSTWGEEVWGPSTELDFATVFADAAIYTSDMVAERLKLVDIDIFFNWPNEPTSGTVTLEFEGGQQVHLDPAESDVTFRAELYGRWVVIEWVLDETAVDLIEYPDGVSVRDFVCRFLVSRDKLEEYDRLTLDLSTGDAWLESSLIRTGPRRVRRMFWKVGNFLFSLGDPVRIEPGFNIDLHRKEAGDTGFRVDSDPAVRDPVELFLDAVPGAGKGKYLRCLPRDTITTVNGVGPDELGELTLDPIECYWLEKPLASGPVPIIGGQVDEVGTVEPHELKLHNACVECCSCENYVRVYQNLVDLWDRAKTATDRVYDARDAYLLLRAALVAKGAGEYSIQVLPRSRSGFVVDVSVMFVNGSDTLIPASQDVKMTFDLSPAPSEFTGEYVAGSGMYTTKDERNRPIDLDGDWPLFEIDFTGMALPSGATILWQGSFRVTQHSSYNRGGTTLDVRGALEVDDTEIASGVGSVSMKPPEDLD